MRVFLTGATGYVGHELLKQLLLAGYEARCLVREGSAGKLPGGHGLEIVTGDVTDADSLQGKMVGCDVVINLVGIIKEIPSQRVTFERLHYEASKNVIDAAVGDGVERFLQMSALGVRAEARACYHRTKYQAEEYLKQSRLAFTIFRPSIIFGSKDQSINMMSRIMKLSPVFPVIGNGKNKWQPVAVENVVQGFVAALNNPKAENKTYEVGGPQAMEYDQVLNVIADVLGKKIIKIHQPISLMKPIVAIMEKFTFSPLNLDQLIMLGEDNVCDEKPFFSDFGITPIGFKEGISSYM